MTELFYSREVGGGVCRLDAEESAHAVKVLRHRKGDCINVIDGLGTMYVCVLTSDSPKAAEAEIRETHAGWGSHPYRVTLAVCPTKNNDRYEWFVEKATELGVDEIVPVIGDRSERKIYKTERARKIALSAAKQSLKAAVPVIREPLSVSDFLREQRPDALRLIACCYDDGLPRVSVREALSLYGGNSFVVMIGPEGDFSPSEVSLAFGQGYRPVSLGPSRLRTETAAVTAAAAVYFKYL